METIKEKVLRAWDKTAEIEVTMEDGIVYSGMVSNAFSEICGKSAVLLTTYGSDGNVTDHRHLPYKEITDIRFMDVPSENESPAESYDIECLWECSSKATYLRERIRKGELKFINDVSGAAKIVSADPQEAEDVAKERWRRVHKEIKGVCNVTLAVGINCTNEDLDKMAAAPEMLAKLEEVAKGASVIKVGGEDVTIIVPGLLLDINEVIKKARGK